MFIRKIKSQKKLKTTLARIAKHKKVVFTNGCFDILHKGHVRYLFEAKRLGDILVVALNSDASVKRLKGKERPINTLADRLEVIAGLGAVDFVTWFEEDTPKEVICLLKPNLIVKGGDWKVEQIVGYRESKAWGGKVKSLSFVKGYSTTRIIERSRK